MAKSSKFFDGVKRILNIQPEPTEDQSDISTGYRSISDTEIKKLISGIYTQRQSRLPAIDKTYIPSVIEPIAREFIDRQADREKLMSLAPEIEQAASILVPSILTPNDFRKNVFSISIDTPDESDEVKTQIINLLTEHFSDDLDIPVKLSTWVTDAMYRIGSKAILVLPTATVAALRKKLSDGNKVSTEQIASDIKTFVGDIERSVEAIDVKVIETRMLADNEAMDRIFSTQAFDEAITVEGKIVDSKMSMVRTKLSKGVPKAIDHFKKSVVMCNDPRFIIKHKLETASALESINSDVLTKLGAPPEPIFYNKKETFGAGKQDHTVTGGIVPYIDLSEFIFEDAANKYPALIELPGESVVPIITEGAPDTHIGYFILLNEHGNPISVESNNFNNIIDSRYGSQRINKLYDSFYGTQLSDPIYKKMSIDSKIEILGSIYDSFIKNIMTTKLSKLGLDKHNISLTGEISRVMFTRMLKNVETRVIYVPKSILKYMAFQYNHDGTGRSKIDNIKFPLSLKMTLIVTRLISLIESSINRRNLNITLDEGIGNPLEILRTIKKDIVSNKMYGLSYDPSTIIKGVLDKELTIIPNKIPGVEEFSISDTANNVEYPKPDDAILDEINNMYMLTLGVPPSAMNRLSEDEFSRSVAANNIFFSNQLKTYQKVVCLFMTDLISSYVVFSEKIKEEIMDVLNNSGDSIEAATEGATDEENNQISEEAAKDKAKKDEEKVKTTEARLRNVIDSIRFMLPSPTFANDKASFEELKDFIEIVEHVINTLYPDELILDADAGAAMKVIRSNTKRLIIQDYIKNNSMLADINFDALTDLDVSSPTEIAQMVLNLKKALDNVNIVFNKDAAAGGTGSW
jgi:hypothetical protein